MTAIALSWTSSISLGAKPDGTLELITEAEEPRLAFSCATATYKCNYGELPAMAINGGEPAETIVSGALALIKKEGIVPCPTTITWTGNCIATSPQAIFVTEN